MSQYPLSSTAVQEHSLTVPFSSSRRWYHKFFGFLLKGSMCVTFSLVSFLLLYVFIKGIGSINLEFLTSSPSYLSNTIGILPDILNTLYLIILTLLFTIPLAIGSAIYLCEYAKNEKVVAIIEFASETLAGIPSIIYGLVGLLFFVQFLDFKTSLLAGSLTLVMMNLPTMLRACEESLKTIPSLQKEAAYGLGATKWQMIKTVVLPGCLDGMLSGLILCVGRIVGESAALLYTAGIGHVVHDFASGIFQSGASLSVALYVYAKEQGEIQVAFGIGVVLLLIVLAINCLSQLVISKMKKGR